jgi:hypothetical protein
LAHQVKQYAENIFVGIQFKSIEKQRKRILQKRIPESTMENDN